MERLVQKRPWPNILELSKVTPAVVWRALKRSLCLVPSSEAAILGDMVRSLKDASEAVLGNATTVQNVRVAIPFLPVWVDILSTYDHPLNDATVLAGLPPLTYETGEPTYLTETTAILADQGRRICKTSYCQGHWFSVIPDEGDDRLFRTPVAFLVSLTNVSLYTSFESNGCFWFHVYDNQLGQVNRQYGLDRLKTYKAPAKFWDGLQSYLVKQVAAYTKYGESRAPSSMVIMAAGEAATRIS